MASDTRSGAIDVLGLIGQTPLVKLKALPQRFGIKATVLAKLEFYNPGGSVKDRIAHRMVAEAEKSGRLQPGDTLIEPTSGNTGIGLALVARLQGYKCIVTMPEKMSAEKVAVLRALNATIIRTPTEAAFDSPESHIGVARRLVKEIPRAHMLDQYSNPNNPAAHEYGTAEEIWHQTSGKVSVIAAGAGTGGTITGLARGLRKHNPEVKIIAADPDGSVLALPEESNSPQANQPYKVEGIGYDFVPDTCDRIAVDHWYKTNDRESFAYARMLISEEGLLVGGSSGSAFAAVVKAAKDFDLGEDDTVVMILPDSVRNYLTKFIDNDWLAANDLLPKDASGRDMLSRMEETSLISTPLDNTTVQNLRLRPLQSVQSTTSCREATAVMREQGFDQLPVLGGTEGRRLVGLVTLGNLLSRINHGRTTMNDPVSKVMFDFSRIPEITTSHRDLVSHFGPNRRGDCRSARNGHSLTKNTSLHFIEITMETPLSALNQFFEWNSAAVITERDSNGGIQPIAIATKVDMLAWLARQQD